MSIRYHVFQFPNNWRPMMKAFSPITELNLFLLSIGLSFLLYYQYQANFLFLCILIGTVLISTSFILEHLGWRTGELRFTEQELFFDGEVQIGIKKGGIKEIDERRTGGLTNWFSYHIIELSSKKYDVKIKCRKKEKDKLIELLSAYRLS